MARRLIGTAVTDSNGEATITYTGTGAGKLNVVAESGTFLSETYELIDCGFYDEAIDNTKASSYAHNDQLTVAYSLSGTTLTHINDNTTNVHFLYNDSAISSTKVSGYYTILNNMAIEFDLTELSGTQIEVYLTDGTNNRSIGLTSTGHYKLVLDGQRINLFKNGEEQTLPETTTMTGTNIRWSFLLNAYNESLTFRNLMIYPI